MTYHRRLLALLLVSCASPAWAQAVPPEGGAAGGVGEIVVTAQRKTENLQDVPLAITAFGSDALDNARITDVRNLSGMSPNVLVTAQGISSIPTISIRGIQSGVSSSAVDPKIGIYLDGVYIGRSVGAIFDLADIERVETLRGPQGTLFGRNATGGAISIVTPAPSGEFGVRALGSVGNYDSFRGRLSVDLPALGIFSARISYLHDESAGDTRNLIGGRTIDLDLREPGAGVLRYADRLGAKNVDAVQVAVRAEPADNVTLDYRFDYTDSRTVGRPAQTAGYYSDAGGSIAAGIASFQGLTGGTDNYSPGKRLKAVANATSVQPLTVEGHSFTVGVDLGDLTLKSISAYRRLNQGLSIYDLAATGGNRFTLAQLNALLAGNVAGITDPAAQPGPEDSLFALLTARESKQYQFSQEFQALISKDAFDLTMGLFYFYEHGEETNILGIFQPVADGVVTPTVLDPLFGSGVNENEATNKAYAAYGQFTYHVTPKFDLTLGLRYTIDKRMTNVERIGGAAAGGGLGIGRYGKTFRRLDYSVIAAYEFNPDTKGYAKVSTGYVAGGIAGAEPYGPEKLTSYELGVKTEMFDRRVRLNVAAFYSDYRGLQIQQFLNGRQIFTNAGKAAIYGGELELETAPVDGLNLSASLGYQHFDYRQYVLSGVDVAGSARPLYSPKFTARLAGRYEFADLGDAGRPFVSADARYRSTTYLTLLPANDPITEAGTKQRPYWLVDARAGLADIAVGEMRLNASFYVQNLFDKDAYTFAPTVTKQPVFYDQSRTYGFELRAEF
ncbi:TonB-dependent receptor [Croceicoccus estronivorus]|uniref:TonB-dependent receptor n=1 Tax=Croceicoccus estronivorus TaxID=1172626 RepID=UPI0008334800|nr:TonB-dependent receptor [Croceicoccus estronivorus]OCC23457.1 TonB-dependent receptor [Croceicoccus estronivorus]